jgi:periplasmic divalent cation tolerance protein
MSSSVFVYVTCPKLSVAEKLATVLIEERLAACANILPQMISQYRWQGRVVREKEVVLILKTKAALFRRLERRTKELHPYECPCIVALPITKGHAPYLRWLAEQVSD